MPKQQSTLPLAVVECRVEDMESRLAGLPLKKNDGYVSLETNRVTEPLLLAASDSPRRVLLKPRFCGKDQKKAKKCCDKGCGGCHIPLRSSATIGNFVDRRIRKAMKKDKATSQFHGQKWFKFLTKCSIAPYGQVETPNARKPSLASTREYTNIEP